MSRAVTIVVALLTACADAPPEEVEPQPIDLPEDPEAAGVTVGVRTVFANGESFEVWYPADEATPAGTDTIALTTYVPDDVVERLEGVDLPTWTQAAVRDATPRPLDGPLPVLVFSHGLSGFRTQSATLCAHLASRGYVVVSADHPGRDLATFAPCLFDPPAGECQLGGLFGTDPAPEDIGHLLDWLTDPPDWIAPLIDLDQLGILGHSAGGNSTVTVANADDRFDAALPLAGGNELTRDIPSAMIGGACDAVVQESQLVDAGPTFRDGYWSLLDAGHLAFSDLCRVDMGAVAAELSERDDANALFISQLASLGTDGCPGYTPSEDVETCEATTFLDQDDADRILSGAATRFFDAALKGTGDGVSASASATLVKR